LARLVRGIFYEGGRMVDTPSNERKVDDFAAHIGAEAPPGFQRDPVITA
jgi:hypothetical protein